MEFTVKKHSATKADPITNSYFLHVENGGALEVLKEMNEQLSLALEKSLELGEHLEHISQLRKKILLKP